MDTFFQIGIGLLPGVVFMLVILFGRRAFHFDHVIFLLLLLAVSGCFLVMGMKQMIGGGLFTDGLSRKEMITFANALFIEGAYEEALEVVDTYSADYGYDDECRMLVARVCLAREDYVRADGIYHALSPETDALSKEIQFASNKVSHDTADLAITDYLENRGENIEDYGFTQTGYQETKSILRLGQEDVLADIYDNINEEYSINEPVEICAGILSSIHTANTSIESGEEGKSRKYDREFEKIEEGYPEFLDLGCMKKARVKAYASSGDLRKITENLDDSAPYHELMVAAELYMGGFVEQRDFPDYYQDVDLQGASDVSRQLDQIYQRNIEGISVQEKRKLKERVDAVKKQLAHPALAVLKEQLTAVSDGEAGTDKTKVCLEIAKIENYFENRTRTDSYLSEAIYNSQDCEDDSYVSAMAQIISVIKNDDSDEMENIKNVSEYVETVMDNALTVDVESFIAPNMETTDDVDGEGRSKDVVDFEQVAIDYVSRVKSAVTIGKIDTSFFEHMTARVQVSSSYIKNIDALEAALHVYDCGAEIKDFSLEKIDHTGSDILLCCDVSGSMDESIQDLRNAVSTFIKDKNKKENIAAVMFNDSVVDVQTFGSPDESLISFAENMDAGGGTDMFSAVIDSMGRFPDSQEKNQVLILMTDGQDNDPKSQDEIYKEIGGLALEKGITVYALGLGNDVDTAYLNTIAESGNGDFIYVSDSVSLESFYDMLHGQVYNQYELSYDALDKVTLSGRTLEVVLPSENVRDMKIYSLMDDEEEEKGSTLDALQGGSLSGISPKYIYKGKQDIDVYLKGTGFSDNDPITIKFNGNIDYTVEAQFVDEETYKLTIPASMAVGTYNVEVSINGKKTILQDGFSIAVQGDGKVTQFGPYVFTSAEKIENADGSYTLRGAVQMNGWLHFKRDVVLSGDIEEGSSIQVFDEGGSYVGFDEKTAEGVGRFLAKKGISLDIPALHDFILYNDQENLFDYDDYLADDISIGILEIYRFMFFENPSIKLLPNSIGLYFAEGDIRLPFQDKILGLPKNGAKKIFEFTMDGTAQITDKNVGLVLDVSYKDADKNEFDHSIKRKGNYNQIISLCNMDVYFNGSIKAKINTLKGEYMIGAMIRFPFFAKQSGIGMEIAWKDLLEIDSIKLRLDLSNPVRLPTTIPIEANDFSFTVADIQKACESGDWRRVKFMGTASFSTGTVTNMFPSLEKFFGKDTSIFKMPDTAASIRLSPIQLEADATLRFLETITLAEAGVKIGNFDYSNELLDLDSVNVSGVNASIKAGLMWKDKNGDVDIDMSGRGEFNAHSRLIGGCTTGGFTVNINWWMLDIKMKKVGKIVLGWYTTHDDRGEFVLAYKQQGKNGKIKGGFYYIDEDGNCGKDNGILN